MKFNVKINTDNLTQFEYNLIKLVNTTTFNRQYLDEETCKYAANKLSEVITKDVINKVCDFIKKNHKNYSTNPLGTEYFINDLKDVFSL